MTRQIVKIVMLFCLVAAGSIAVYRYEKNRSAEAKLQAEVERLERRRQHLEDFVSRLTSERRVAEIVVTDQAQVSGHIESTTLMFVEYGRDGRQLPPKFFTIKGNVAHIDALVIKFEHGFTEQNDPLRGHSLVLFYRLFGDHQAPADGYRIDAPGAIPEIYRSADATRSPEAYQFEAELWENFWRLANDAEYRKAKGVRLAQGEGPWTYFYPESVYTVTLEAAGGLSIHQRPIDGIWQEYRDALRSQKRS